MTASRSVLRSIASLPTGARNSLAAACAAAVVLFAGCGGSQTSPVRGVVLVDGKPAAEASIQFVPQGSGRVATGQTDAKGEFAMSTFNPQDGVMPGDYKVVISLPVAASAPKTFARPRKQWQPRRKHRPRRPPAAAC
jgi:hypothetical protein